MEKSSTNKKRDSTLGCQWIVCIFLGGIFLTWLFTRPPGKSVEEQRALDEKADRDYAAYLERQGQGSSSSSGKDKKGLIREIKAELSASEIPCYDVGIAKSGCLWVYTSDNGNNRDGLAKTLCYTAKRYSVSCVVVFDQKQKRLGESMCR